MSEYLYFRGCMARFRTDVVAHDTTAILEQLQLDYTTLDDERCCGSVLLRTGISDAFCEGAAALAAAINAGGWDYVITSCAGCYRTLESEFPQWGFDLDPEVIHLAQLLHRELRAGRLRFEPYPRPITVTYHDPCHLARHAGVYDAPRAILRGIPNIELCEMDHHREEARCCGAGGGLRSSNRALALELGTDRVEEALATGAEFLTSTCPFCEYHLEDAGGTTDSPIAVLDLSALVRKTMVVEETVPEKIHASTENKIANETETETETETVTETETETESGTGTGTGTGTETGVARSGGG